MQTSKVKNAALMAAISLAAMASGATVVVGDSGQSARTSSSETKHPTKQRGPAGGFSQAIQAALSPSGNGSRGVNRRSGPGWSNRHVKRMALKARNVRKFRNSNR